MRSILLLTITAALSSGALAQSAQDHGAHHPANAVAPTSGTSKAPKVPPAQMETQMKSMQAMHQKMMDANTPDERQALMGEHMKAMQDGMAMMGQMGGGPAMMGQMGAGMPGMPMQGAGMSSMPGGMHEDMMQRMAMMQMMMQMMVDREAAMPPAAK